MFMLGVLGVKKMIKLFQLAVVCVIIYATQVTHAIVKRQTSGSSCKITQIPKNGFVARNSRPTEYLSINDEIQNFEGVVSTCIDNHRVIGIDSNLCVDGEWLEQFPECQPRCDEADISSITFVANCRLKNENFNSDQEISCTEPAPPGTIARINCQRGYKSASPGTEQLITCRSNGHWFPPPQPCVQICGQEGPDGSPYIVGGEIANITKVPWHVGIYKKDPTDNQLKQACGGTILNPKVVITAAHCFWDRISNKLEDPADVRIAAGKFFRGFDDSREETKFQTFGVSEIHIPEGYEDYESYFAYDLAVVVLSSYIEYKVNIAPICIEYKYELEEKIVPAGWVGRIAGWGLEENNGSPSDKLKLIEIPVEQRNLCKASISDLNFRPYVTGDKFCAGFRNQDVGLCQGDSGGGMVFPKTIAGKSVFYLRGIVSTGPNKDGSCDSNQYTTFTNVAHFADFIFHYEFNNRPTSATASSPSAARPAATNTSKSLTASTPCGILPVPYHSNTYEPLKTKRPDVVPWNVNIKAYTRVSILGRSRGVHRCDGTIISSRIVLTSMSCLWGELIISLYIATPFLNDSIDRQYRDVQRLDHDPTFAQGLLADVGVVIVDRPFEFNGMVSPICLQLEDEFNDDFYGVSVANVLTWNPPPFILKRVEECKEHLASEFNETVLTDKYCGAPLYTFNEEGCKKLFGAGLLTSEYIDGSQRYVLKGIANLGYAASDDACNIHGYFVFTNIYRYKSLIQRNLKRYPN